MGVLFPDTDPKAAAVLIALLRDAPPWKKLRMLEEELAAKACGPLSGSERESEPPNDQ